MAVVHLHSDVIAAYEAGTQQNALKHRGFINESVAAAAKAAGNDTNSTFRMHRVPSYARISELLLRSDAWGASALIDIGISQTVANGGAAVSAALFANALDVAAAILPWTDVMQLVAPENTGKALWQLLGLSADPGLEYDIVITAEHIGASQAADFALKLRLAMG